MSPSVAVIGAAVGLFIGLLGGGGSILAVPLLARVGLPVPHAVAGGLVLVAAAAAAATARHLRAGQVVGAAVWAFGSVGLVGAYAGARLARFVDPGLQIAGFAVLMIGVGLRMVTAREPAAGAPRSGPPRAALVGVALGVGLLTGLLGAGGGFVLVPAMTLFVGLPIRQAIASSVAVLAITASGALAGYLAHVPLSFGTWLPAAVAAGGAAVAGTSISRWLPERALRRAFGVFVCALGVAQLVSR